MKMNWKKYEYEKNNGFKELQFCKEIKSKLSAKINIERVRISFVTKNKKI